jgi:serine/threonine protein kinase
MAAASTDRNLLVGILALQMDFIGKDALIVAMNAWVLDKSRPLGDILAEQGALKPEHRTLLDALVQAHLAQHDGDPARSLAALSSLGAARRDLEQVADPDVQASLGVVASAWPADDPNATHVQELGEPTSKGLRFRVLRPHARGGLGEVFVARDEELHREVALKEIQPRFADHPQSRARFLLEAEVTGGLEHPGVVPVYGLGAYADGRPFYAMRFIRGDSLKEAIKRFHTGSDGRPRKLTRADFEGSGFRGLLRRFVDVCNAIAYAHSRRVLHRDLKPGNIMLGKYGETLVVDWGLAKPLGRDGQTPKSPADEAMLRPDSASGTEETLPGEAVGTPEYMSPEQAAGRKDLLGPASDIYSLGATLYTALTGRAPVTGKYLQEVLRAVECGDWPPPRQVQPAVPPALEAVCRKALALQPEDRYASALDLAADVEHWLADEPVSAFREPLTARLRRWGRRHRPLVAGAASLLVMAVVLLVVLNVQSEQARLQSEQARLALAKEQHQTELERQATARERDSANAHAESERNAKLDAQRLLGLISVEQGLREADGGDIFTALLRFAQPLVSSPDHEDTVRMTRHRVANYWTNSQCPVLLQQWRGSSVDAISPDGRRVVTARVAAISLDGRRVLTASVETVRVWDAATGQPLTPPLSHGLEVRSAAFSPGGRRVLTASADGTARVWDVSDDPRPIGDLVRMVQLLSGHRIDTAGIVVPLSTAELQGLWDDLHQRYPTDLTVSPAAARAWREWEIRDCLREGNLQAAEFHYWWLVAEMVLAAQQPR